MYLEIPKTFVHDRTASKVNVLRFTALIWTIMQGLLRHTMSRTTRKICNYHKYAKYNINVMYKRTIIIINTDTFKVIWIFLNTKQIFVPNAYNQRYLNYDYANTSRWV